LNYFVEGLQGSGKNTIADQDMASMSRSTYRRLISSIQNISLMIYFNLEAKIFRENLV
jgi:hypothetical protein